MTNNEIHSLLESYKNNLIGKDELIHILTSKGYTDLGHTKVDTSRMSRTGFPEVVFCKNKTDGEIIDISVELYRKNGFALLTKATGDQYSSLKKKMPESVFHERAGIIVIGRGMKQAGNISVLSGGTSDTPVAEEAAITAEVFGCNVNRIYDVGVAGLHRLLSFGDVIKKSNAVVAVAGMEGALPSVVGGLFGIPIIGVPTSIGYGAGLGGLTPLLTMLNSCAPGVCVVNIDNGFGAGYLASLINKRIQDATKE